MNIKKDLRYVNLEKIVSLLPGNVFWKDRDGYYLGCNDNVAKILKLQHRSEIVGKRDPEIIGEDLAKEAYIVDQKVIKDRKEYVDEQIGFDANGNESIYLTSKLPILDESNEVVGILGLSFDITERKKAEIDLRVAKEKAEAASKAKSEFLMNMRHDVRTPLTGIIGFANLIKNETSSTKVEEYADNMLASSYALLDFLNEVLETVRMTSGEVPLVKKKFDLKNKLTSIINLNQARAAEKQLKLELNFDEKIPQYLIGDPTRLHRIVLELVTNAINFTHEGEVKVTAELAKKEKREAVIKIIVSDTGVGIPADKKDEIFVRFKRLTSSYDGVYKGLGLGLSVVKQFIDDLDAELYVESESNKGSMFTCIFPFKTTLLDDEQGVAVESEAKLTTRKKVKVKTVAEVTGAAENLQGLRVLLVEDQPIAALAAKGMLEELHCNVDIAENGRAAILKSKTEDYDLIFMDVGLPDAGGCDITREIRAWEINLDKHTPIIALTAHVEVEDKQQCIEAGMDAVLSKPLLKETAIDILNAFIPKSASLQKKSKIEKTTAPTKDNSVHDHYSLIEVSGNVVDVAIAMKLAHNDEAFAKQMLTMLVESFPDELTKITEAYKHGDWQTMRDVAHKMKGATSYCGTPRLKIVCANLEGYLKSPENTELRESLYQQLLAEIEAVKQEAKRMLSGSFINI